MKEDNSWPASIFFSNEKVTFIYENSAEKLIKQLRLNVLRFNVYWFSNFFLLKRINMSYTFLSSYRLNIIRSW